MKIDILYEDKDIAAIMKPAGIAVHHDGKTDEDVITDWLLKKFPKIKNVGEPLTLVNGTEVSRPGIVHRLDKDTSGVLLVAKTNEAYESLKEQFQNREVKKTYHAFVYGKLKDERGTIDRPIGRATGSIRKWATGSKTRGELRDAVTKYKVLKFASGRISEVLGASHQTVGNSSACSLLEIWPQTGRTHQIRVHMHSLGHPVVADSLYAPGRAGLLGFERLALHASRIVFTDLKGERREVAAPFPQDFEKAIKAIA